MPTQDGERDRNIEKSASELSNLQIEENQTNIEKPNLEGKTLITRDEYDELSKRFRNAQGEEMEEKDVPGYYKRKVKYAV